MPDFIYYGNNKSLGKDVLYRDLVERTGGRLAVDVETMSLNDLTPIGIGFATTYTDSYYFPVDSPLLPRALKLLSNPGILKIIHNAHFDLKVIEGHWGIKTFPLVDTIIAAQLLGYPPALGQLALALFQVVIPPISELIGKGKSAITMDKVPLEKVAHKCCLDVECSLRLWDTIGPQIPPAAFALEMKVMPILLDMERRGIGIDEDVLEQHIKRISKNVSYYRAIARGYGFNPGSSKQLAAILQSRGWNIRYKRDTGNPIMNEEAIVNLYGDDPLAQLSLLYRKQRVLLTNTLLPIRDKFLLNGRIHPRFHQNVVNTGRLSSTNPNSMNITEFLRDIIIPTQYCLFEDWDLSQIELRVLAYISQDPTMMAVFNDPNGDIHNDTADYIFGSHDPSSRRISKDINFAIVYGGDEHTLFEKSRVPLEVGVKYIELYFQRFPGVKVWIEETRAKAHQLGYTETMLGRRRTDINIHSTNPRQMEHAERQLINHPIQGSAGEILKELMFKLATARQVNAIHDETLMERDPGYTPDYNAVYNIAPFKTPATVKIGPNWKEVSEITTIGF